MFSLSHFRCQNWYLSLADSPDSVTEMSNNVRKPQKVPSVIGFPFLSPKSAHVKYGDVTQSQHIVSKELTKEKVNSCRTSVFLIPSELIRNYWALFFSPGLLPTSDYSVHRFLPRSSDLSNILKNLVDWEKPVHTEIENRFRVTFRQY